MNIKKEIMSIIADFEKSKIVNRTKDLFFLIEDGLNDCKNAKNKISSNEKQSNDLFYALCYEYEKGNISKTFKAVDILDDYPELCSDTTYYYLNACHGMFDKGYLMELCMKKDITSSINLVFEKETEIGKTICREIITFTKPYNKNLVKTR